MNSEREPLLTRQQIVPDIEAAGAPTGPGADNDSSVVQPRSHGHGTFPTPPDSDDEYAEGQTAANTKPSLQAQSNESPFYKIRYVLPVVGIGIWLSAADQTLVVSSYGRIGSELKELNKTNWIATAYLLTITSFQPLYGKLSDLFGRKAMLLLAYVLFGLGCLWCGTARSMDELIIARAFSGIGGGGMTTVVSIMMSDLVPLKDRGLVQGVINIIFAAGSGIGAPLGGFLADTIGWRWAFTGQAPLCLIAFIACYFVLDLPHTSTTHWTANVRRIDFAGAFTLVSAVALLLTGLDRGSNVAWDDKVAIMTLSISLPMFLLFILVESKFSIEPFAPGHVIFTRPMLAGYLCNFFSFGGWFGVLFYMPLYFQAVDKLSASQAGLRLVPGIICGVTGSLAAGLIMGRTGRYKALTISAYALLALASIPLVLCTGLLANSTPGIILALMMAGLGNGTGVTSTLIALISNAQPEDQAVATACSYLFRSLGSVLGLSAVSTFLQQRLKTKLTERLSADGSEVEDIVRRVRESLEYIGQLPESKARIVRDTYGESLERSFLIVGAIVTCAFISSCKLNLRGFGKRECGDRELTQAVFVRERALSR